MALYQDLFPEGDARRLEQRSRSFALPFDLFAEEVRAGFQKCNLQRWDLMQTLREKQGFTAVLVTHAIDEAVQLADRIAVMAPGPGRITATVPVDLPFPRPSQVRADPRFGRHVEHVRALLGLAGAPTGAAPTDRQEP